VDRAVIITPAENYQLPPEAHKQLSVRVMACSPFQVTSIVKKLIDIWSSVVIRLPLYTKLKR
jgi:hypothetical protein